MRVLMVTDFYHPSSGGVEQHVRGLSRELVARGHEVAVATLRAPGLPELELDAGVRIHRLASTAQRMPWLYSQPRPWAPPVPDPETMLALNRVLSKEQPQVVHGHDWLVRSFVPLKRRSGARLVVSLHYYTSSCPKKNLMHRGVPCGGPALLKCLGCAGSHYGTLKGSAVVLGNQVMSRAERRAVDMFIAVSQTAAIGNELIGSGLPFRVIPNFVPNSLTGPADDDAYTAQLPAGDFLLFVGDLSRLKGIEVLLRAYAGLPDAPPLVLIGKDARDTPPEWPRNVKVLKNWPNEAVMTAWRRCLVALVPSILPEPFGIVAIEAMACGRPVIASRIGGLAELLIDGETGVLVPPADPVALRQALQRLLADPAERKRMGQAARLVATRLHANVVVPRIERIYAELVGGEGITPALHPLDRPAAPVGGGPRRRESSTDEPREASVPRQRRYWTECNRV